MICARSDGMSEAIVRVRNLVKAYGKHQAEPVLKGVDFDLPPGVVMGLIGTNGAGKSTLIKCLLGLLRITSGEALVFGEDPWDLSAKAKARIGYVPQEPSLLPWMTMSQSMRYAAAFYSEW